MDQCFSNPGSEQFRPDVYNKRTSDCKRKKGSLSARFLALGEPKAKAQYMVTTVEDLLREMEDSPLSDTAKDLVVEELIDVE